eukprot:TRINITY_DN313_c0_g2_i1.p1 TRINITY_DN313_c0_g2~~TRINITY_DN313_c0_g2_i1.p1  ORF type:complete len:229 (+),score=62.39 TRINITY_DN313_c0_g2_i1:76-762(+)
MPRLSPHFLGPHPRARSPPPSGSRSRSMESPVLDLYGTGQQSARHSYSKAAPIRPPNWRKQQYLCAYDHKLHQGTKKKGQLTRLSSPGSTRTPRLRSARSRERAAQEGEAGEAEVEAEQAGAEPAEADQAPAEPAEADQAPAEPTAEPAPQPEPLEQPAGLQPPADDVPPVGTPDTGAAATPLDTPATGVAADTPIVADGRRSFKYLSMLDHGFGNVALLQRLSAERH